MAGYSQNYAAMFGQAAQDACMDVAEKIVAEIRSSPLTPSGKTGRLRAGYEASRDGRGAKITGVSYWAHVEYGHAIVDSNDDVVGHVGQRAHVRPAIEFIRRQLAQEGDE